MPRYVTPSSMPAELTRSMSALMVPLAWGIVRVLSMEGPSTTRELADHLDVQPITVLKRLEPLLNAGLLTTPTEAGQRQGRQVRYAVDAEAVEETVAHWVAYLRGREAHSAAHAASASVSGGETDEEESLDGDAASDVEPDERPAPRLIPPAST